MKNLAFSELVDIGSLQLIQDSFSEYSGLSIEVVDTEGSPVTKYSGNPHEETNDFEIPVVIGGKTVGNIIAWKAPGMTDADAAKTEHFLSEFSKALSILAYSNYKKILKSRKMENAARSQISYIMGLTDEVRVNMKEWIDFFKTTTDKYKDMPEVRQETDQILEKGKEVYSVIDGVVDYIRLSGGNAEYSESVYHVRQLIEDIEESVRNDAAEVGVTIEDDFDPSLPETLMGNSGRIGQAVSKLIGGFLKIFKTENIKLLASCESGPYACVLCIKVMCTGCSLDAKAKKTINKALKKSASVDLYIEDNAKHDDMQLSSIVYLISRMYGNISFEELGEDEVMFVLEIPQLNGEKTSA